MQLDWQVYARAEQFLAWNAQKKVFNVGVDPQWIEKSDRFWYMIRTRRGKEFILVDPAAGTREPAFDHQRLAAALSQTSGKAYEAYHLPFDKIAFADGGKKLRFDVGDTGWTVNLKDYACQSGEKVTPPEHELRSPDGKWAAYTKDYNLWVRNLETGEEVALTTDGKRYYDYGSQPESRTTAVTEKLAGKRLPPAAVWSSDSKRLISHRLDQRKVKDLHLLQHVPADGGARPVLHSYRYAIVGDKDVPLSEQIIFDVESRTATPFKLPPELALYAAPITNGLVWWGPGDSRAYLIRLERGFKKLTLYEIDTETGAARQVLDEAGETQVEVNLFMYPPGKPNVRVIKQGAEVVWFSQRDGWAQLYRYDAVSGSLKNKITASPLVVRDIKHIDEKGGWVYFTAGGRADGVNPYYQHFYRARLDGADQQLLSEEDANHFIIASPSGKYFVDTYSRIDIAPVTVLRSTDGKVAARLEEGDIADLLAAGWHPPESFSLKASDGITDLYGAIYRPTNFDPSQQYPVLDAIYPGPQITRTPSAFPHDMLTTMFYWEAQAVAELGFIVITVDGPGTPFRSKAFHDASYGKVDEMGGLADHIHAFKQLRLVHPYLDLNRVGIFGHSGGGNASARAMFQYPDFYKVAVSSAGNHDQRSYLAVWGERYQGLLEGDNYDKQVNARLAHNLKGKLLLIYGEMDDNVHPNMTFHVIDALIKANKDFDLLVLPNRNHAFTSDPYFIRRKWDYFVRHLLGLRPPQGYEIQPGA